MARGARYPLPAAEPAWGSGRSGRDAYFAGDYFACDYFACDYFACDYFARLAKRWNVATASSNDSSHPPSPSCMQVRKRSEIRCSPT